MKRGWAGQVKRSCPAQLLTPVFYYPALELRSTARFSCIFLLHLVD